MSRKHLVHLRMFITERLASECCASVSVPPQDIGLGYGITILPMDVSAGVSPLFAAKVPSPPVGTPGQGGGGGDCAQPNADFSVRSTMPNCLLS